MSCAPEILEEQQALTLALPAPDELPETVIERRPGWRLVNLGELWRYRELLFFLIWRDIKVRYKETVLGVAWTILQPLATMVIFSLFLGRMAAAPDGIPYPLFALAGIVPWTYFASAISNASQSVVGSQNLITKVYFPRLLIPVGAVGAGLVDYAVAFGMLLILAPCYGMMPGLSLCLVPLLTAALVIAALGVGTLLSALTVAYRDFRYVTPFLVQLWMFATPCVYMETSHMFEPHWQLLLPLNPAYGLIISFRQAILGGPLDLYALTVSAGVSCVVLLMACFYFRRIERSFADVI